MQNQTMAPKEPKIIGESEYRIVFRYIVGNTFWFNSNPALSKKQSIENTISYELVIIENTSNALFT